MSQIKSRRFLAILFAVPLMLSLCLALCWSLRWPLVGDATLIHYVVFLISKGLTPYQQIIDINLPGSYLFEALGMRLFGWGALAWRFYDFFLLVAVGGAALLITGRRNAFAAIFAGTLFALIHIQDGIAELGQRDLLIAALLLWSYAALFKAQKGVKSGRFVFIFGLLIGATFTIKPTFIPLAILLLCISARPVRHSGADLTRYLASGFAGIALPCFIVVAWLYHLGVLHSFLTLAETLIPFHAALGRRSLAYLLAHVTSPIILLCAAWLVVLFLIRPKLTTERIELLAGTACALFAYVVQGKGYPYHRYPFLVLVLVLIGIDLTEALTRDRLPRLVAVIGLAIGCFAIAPRAAWLARSFRPETPFQESLGEQLRTLDPQLSGKVQCLDTFGGCINTLYDLRIVQSTGYLYDCYLFTPRQNAVTAKYRKEFFEAYQSAQPKIIVLTDQFCFGNPGGFQKMEAWPEFQREINKNYALATEWTSSVEERWWSRSEAPPRYRIYRRK